MSTWSWLIGHLPFEWAQYTFMQNALLGVILICPLFAFLGAMVINNHLTFYSEAIGHAALTGIAIGVVVGLRDPVWAMIAFALVLALAVTGLRRWSSVPTDTVVGLIMAFSVALGVVLLSRGGGFGRYSRYLIGDILTLTPGELRRLFWVDLVIGCFWGVCFNRLFFGSLSRPLARSRGVSVWLYEALFAAAVAVVVTVCIPWVGLLVINSMLILPAATARNAARNTLWYSWGALVVSLTAGIAGLVCSYYWGTATGATVVLFAMGMFLASLFLRRG